MPSIYFHPVGTQLKGKWSRAEQDLARLKKQFGLHCHLLQINSQSADSTPHQREAISSLFEPYVDRPPAPPSKTHTRNASSVSTIESVTSMPEVDPSPLFYGTALTDLDIETIRNCVVEIVTQDIVPNLERSIQTWNEQVASGRRGISGKFLSVSRKYFSGPSKPTNAQIVHAPLPGGGASETFSVYPVGTPEHILRRLADCAVMMRDFKFAMTIYDLIRKDFQNEKAWKYYAGAQVLLISSLRLDEYHQTEFGH